MVAVAAVLRGLGAVGLGVAWMWVAAWLRRNDAFQTRVADSLIRGRVYSERQRPQLARGFQVAAVFGIAVGALVVVLGVVAMLGQL